MAVALLALPALPANDNSGGLPPIPPTPFRLEAWARGAIEARIEKLIAILDAADGDADLEDEPADGCGTEDDFGYDWSNLVSMFGPGCPISDPDCSVEDLGCDEEETLVPIYGIDQTAGVRAAEFA